MASFTDEAHKVYCSTLDKIIPQGPSDVSKQMNLIGLNKKSYVAPCMLCLFGF